MNTHDEIMKRGEYVYETYARRSGFTYCNRVFADASSTALPAYIFAEERFISGHDDSAGFNENIIKSWKFEYPMKKRFRNPDYYDDDCLVYYLEKRFHLSAVGYRAPE